MQKRSSLALLFPTCPSDRLGASRFQFYFSHPRIFPTGPAAITAMSAGQRPVLRCSWPFMLAPFATWGDVGPSPIRPAVYKIEGAIPVLLCNFGYIACRKNERCGYKFGRGASGSARDGLGPGLASG